MAKKTKESIVNAKSISSPKSEKSGFGFNKISEIIQNISKKTAILIENNDKERTYISTGIYILDALLAKSILHGGVSRNRITVFAGDPQTGKSYILYGICRNAQKEGYNVIFIDTEYSIELNDLKQYGIDISPDKLMLIRSNIVEDLKITLTQLLDKLKEEKMKGTDIGKTIICLDSIGQLASRKEVEDALNGKEKADMTKAKAIKSLFRIICSDLGYLSIPLCATNHVYMSLDLFPKAIMTGGKSAEYSASTIVHLTIAKLKTGEEETDSDVVVGDIGQSGVIVTAKSVKNRLCRPKKIKFKLSHLTGANKFASLEYFLTPLTFDRVGIAKVKPEIDKSTGEITYKPASKWYVKHLDKSFYERELYTDEIFTPVVLNNLEDIISKYFSYTSFEEQQAELSKMEKEYGSFEQNDDLEIGEITDEKLFD